MSAEVVFRLDASRALGAGHLSRSGNLALALHERGVRSAFVVGGEGGADLARERLPCPAEVLEAASPSGSAADLERTLATARGAAWLVVDHYTLPSSFLAELSGRGARVCVVDDLGDRDLSSAALVVNPTPAGRFVDYPQALAPRLLRGDYAMLHPAFGRATRPLPTRAGAPERVLVCFGGTDATGGLSRAVAEARACFPGARIRAVRGLPGPADDGADERFFAEGPEAMAAHMAWADLAIATASTIAWELAAVGTPAVLVKVAENQEGVLLHLEDIGGLPAAASIEGLREALARYAALPFEALRERTARMHASCDGLGAARFAGALMERRATVV